MKNNQNPRQKASALASLSNMRHWALALLAAVTLAACGGDGSSTEPSPGPQPLELTILHVNDHHSNLDSKRKTLQLLDAGGKRVGVTVDAGGFPRVTSAFAELAAESEHVLKLHAGDALTGTLYFSRAGERGEADAAMMNTVCFDAFTLGNHEFDKGDTSLKQWLDLLNSGECRTPILSANVRFGADSALHPSRAEGAVQPYAIVERGGQKIGVVGLTIAEKTKTSSSPDPGTTFENETVAAQRAIDELRGRNIDKIVLLSHIGYDYDKRVLAELSGADVIIGGDSHTLLGPESLAEYGVGSPAGPYGQALKNRDGDTVCLAQAWEYSQVVGELKVSFDKDGRVTACHGTPHVLIGDDFQIGNAPAGPADHAAFEADVAASGFLRLTAPDAHASGVLQPYAQSVEIYKQTEVANAPLELCSRRLPGGPGTADYDRSSVACNDEGSVNMRGGDIQQLVVQAYLEVANQQYGGADFTLQGGGSARIPLQGRVTAADVIEVIPFDNKLWKLNITGVEAKAMVEDGLEAVFGPGGGTGPYPYTGGLRWDVDANRPKGVRASNFERFDRATGAWLPLDDAGLYSLFTLHFNAMGGDGYATLAQVPAERRYDVGVQDADMFLNYIDGLPPDATGLPALERLDHSLYSTKSYIGPAAQP